MRILRRYFLMEFIRLFLLVSVGLSSIICLINVLQALSTLMQHNLSVGKILLYASLQMPMFFLYIMPMAALLCGIFVISSAVRSRELMAVMAAGGRLKKLFAPFILTGILMSVFGFILSEYVISPASTRAKEIKDGVSRKKGQSQLFKNSTIWLRTDSGSIVQAEIFLADENVFRGVQVFRVTGDGIAEIVRAEDAVFIDGGWMLRNARATQTGTGVTTVRATMPLTGLGNPELLKKDAGNPAELGITELYDYLRRLKESGFGNVRLSVDFYSKITYPLVSLIMLMLGIAFSANRNMKGLVATGIGIVISLLYWLGFSMMLSFGYAGIVSPILAASGMPLLFTAASAYLYSRIPE